MKIIIWIPLSLSNLITCLHPCWSCYLWNLPSLYNFHSRFKLFKHFKASHSIVPNLHVHSCGVQVEIALLLACLKTPECKWVTHLGYQILHMHVLRAVQIPKSLTCPLFQVITQSGLSLPKVLKSFPTEQAEHSHFSSTWHVCFMVLAMDHYHCDPRYNAGTLTTLIHYQICLYRANMLMYILCPNSDSVRIQIWTAVNPIPIQIWVGKNFTVVIAFGVHRLTIVWQ